MDWRLLPILQKHNLISPSQEKQLLDALPGITSEVTAIIELGLLDSPVLAKELSSIFNLPLIALDSYDYSSVCQELGLRKLITSHTALPVNLKEHTLTLALTDPTNDQAIKDFQFATNYQVEMVLADHLTIVAAINKLYGEQLGDDTETGKDVISEELSKLITSAETDSKRPEDLSNSNEPIARYIHQILLEAIGKNASDIHFEPYEDHYRIRLRLDGILFESQPPPAKLAKRLSARIKIMSQLDISEKRIPQDGRMKIKLKENMFVDLRVSTLPTLWGEKIVLRLLDRRTVDLDINTLGMTPRQADLYWNSLHTPQGLILVTGPTGSGKTVSLFSGLNILNKTERNISTAEDPVEINIPGINQVQINNKIGFGFSQALRAFLRQDPDIVMIGEIRDLETAEIAVKAAQTGHLVLSTLHTNSALESLSRLKNIGVSDYNIVSSLNLMIAQRLCRKLCSSCKLPAQIPTSIKELFEPNAPIYQANSQGCQKCHSGYLGRTGLYEVIEMTAELKDAMARSESILELESIARKQGAISLKQSGIEKLKQGITSYAELQRILKLSL
ncbi:type IV-A pilus assembly ATPase PilB [Vibrio sp. HN007]|uniref:type IV-A pilus assembly ATPase PilB n=1 Tax=Vibrio iocasae TaxID=3098914 RepID=UPI0035D518CF